MAIVNNSRLFFKSGKYIFDLELRGKIISVGGDSGTGKSLMYDRLTKEIINDLITGVSCFNATSKPNDLRELIFRDRNELVVIDNVDILLVDWDDPKRLRKSNNRYILFTRNPQFYGILENCQAKLVCKKLKSLKTGKQYYKFTLSYLE